MNNSQKTERLSELSKYDIQGIMEHARAERAKMVLQFFKKLSLRQVQPIWDQTFKLIFSRFSH